MLDPQKAQLIIKKVSFDHDEVLESFVENLELWWRRNITALTSPVLKAFFRDVLNNCERYVKKTNDPKYADVTLLMDEDEILDEVLIAEIRDKGKTVAFARMRKNNFKRNYTLKRR